MPSPVSSLTVNQAISRVNQVQQIYSAELRRCEGVFASLAVPATLAFAAVAIAEQANMMLLVFVGLFCGTYALLLYLDLHAVGLRSKVAGRLQDRLYAVPVEYGDKPLDSVPFHSGKLTRKMQEIEDGIGVSPYISPAVKPIVALTVSAVVSVLFQLGRSL